MVEPASPTPTTTPSPNPGVGSSRISSEPKGLWVNYYYDRAEAHRALRFIQKQLRHTEGEHAGRPFILERWQRKIILKFFGWRRRSDNSRKFRVLLLFIPRKNGKALALDTPIPTPTGWTTMGDLSEGDSILGSDGRPCRVTFATPVQLNRDCYRVVFGDGSEIVADADHQWQVEDAVAYANTADRKRSTKVLTTSDMVGSVFVSRPDKQTQFRYSVPVCQPLQLPVIDLPLSPYLFGAWLGDGSSGGGRITIGHDELSHFKNEFDIGGYPLGKSTPDSGNCSTYRIGSGDRKQSSRNNSFQAKLNSLGVLNNKHVPQQFLRASELQRMALLQGLMDTDGYVSAAGQCEFTTCDNQILSGVLELLCSLGFKPSVKTCDASIYGRVVGIKHRVQFWAYQGRSVFRMERKTARLKPAPKARTRSSVRKIVDIVPVPSVAVRCIQVDSPDSLFLAGRNFIPTHNTAFAAAIALYLQFADREAGAQIVCAASDKDQAKYVFNMASNMVQCNPLLAGMANCYKTSVFVPNSNSVFKVLSKKPNTKHGGNVHGAIIDEVHAIEDRELVDVITTSTIARKQPVTVYASTAGFDKTHFFYDLYSYGKGVADGRIDDETWLPVIYEADPEKWKDPEEWKRANPNFGVTMDMESFMVDFRLACELPSYENRFKRLRLNIWTEQDSRVIPMDKWDACVYPEELYPVDALKGQDCFLGLDLASTTDFASAALVFPPTDERPFYDILMHYWFPEGNAVLRKKRLRLDVLPWKQQGLLTLTPGEVIDYDRIRNTIKDLGKVYKIREIAIDRWNATQLSTQLDGDGFVVVPTGQGFATMSDPTKFLLGLVLQQKINHHGHKILSWNAANLSCQEDAAGNMKPSKEKSKEKIDGMVATIMALSRATANAGGYSSVYETRGVIVIG